MAKIELQDIRFYSNHGCLEEEAKIGSEYRLDITVETKIDEAAKSDELEDAVDYCSLTEIGLRIAKQRHKLLETVVRKIGIEIIKTHASVKKVKVSLGKINPPINANVGTVTVSEELKRKWIIKEK